MKDTFGVTEALQKSIDNLQENDAITAVEYKNGSLYIYNNLNRKFVFPVHSEYRSFDIDSEVSSLTTYKYYSNVVEPYSVSPEGSKKALILSDWQSEFNDDVCSMKNNLESVGFSVDVIIDTDEPSCGITKSDFHDSIYYYSNLDKYDFIHIAAHGGEDSIITGIPASTNEDDINDFWYNNIGVNDSFMKKNGVNVISINSRFIRDNYKDNKKLKKSLVYIDACHSAADISNFADAFIESGAAVYLGYNNAVLTRYSHQFEEEFYPRICNYDVELDGALQNCPQHWSNLDSEYFDDRYCYLLYFGCVETDLDLVVIKSDEVENDPEGFILAPSQINTVNGEIAYYPLDTDADDAVGSNDGDEAPSSLDYVSGVKNNAASFDGVDDYIDFPHNPIYGNNTFSVSLWFKIDQTAPYDGYNIFNMGNNKSGTTSNEEEFAIVIGEYGSTLYVSLRDVYQNNSVTSFNQDITTGTWHHIACIITPSQLTVYIDGARRGEASITDPFNLTSADWDNMRIGSQNRDGGTRSLLKGLVDEVRIYDEALTDAEVASLYNLN